MDAINELFTQLELAYHNQFHRAFPGHEQLHMAKQLWLHSLADLPPQRIRAGARRAIRESEFVPNLAAMRRFCEPVPADLGLPDAYSAYLEACRAPSPKDAQNWSHPAVYHAGRASDWFLLARAPEREALPVFRRNYEIMVRRVLDGEELETPVPEGLPSRVARPLSQEERRRRLLQLRSELGI